MSASEAKTTKFHISDAILRSLNDSSKDKAALAPAKAHNRKFTLYLTEVS